MDITSKSWFMRYAPTTVNDLVFDSAEHQTLVNQWVSNEQLDGNVLFHGPAGLGKTVTSEILIMAIIKAQNDLHRMKSRLVKEIDTQIIPFVKKRPVKSKHKIVYIEEVDRISSAGQNQLKDGILEKYQQSVSFICCTNYIKNVESALLTRFTYKIPFSGTNLEGIIKRLHFILTTEQAQFDETELIKFVHGNYRIGIREMINQLQISYMSNQKIINFKTIQQGAGIEENIVLLVVNILNAIQNMPQKGKRDCYLVPLTSPITADYTQLVTLTHNNYDVNYNLVFDRLIATVSNYFPVLQIIVQYSEETKYKKHPHFQLLGCLSECIKCLTEITG